MKLIKISSVWCPSCLIMQPRYMDLVKKFNLTMDEYDYDIDTEIVDKYFVGDILPVVIVLDGEREMTRIIGEKSNNELNKIFKDMGV